MTWSGSYNPWKDHHAFMLLCWAVQCIVMAYVSYEITLEVLGGRNLVFQKVFVFACLTSYVVDAMLITQIVAFIRNRLELKAMFFMQVLESVYWTAALALFWGLSFNTVAIPLAYNLKVTAFALFFYTTLMETIVIYRKERHDYVEVPTAGDVQEEIEDQITLEDL